jgi:hypothetical protein
MSDARRTNSITAEQLESLYSIVFENEDNFRFYAESEYLKHNRIPDQEKVEIFLAGAKWLKDVIKLNLEIACWPTILE